MVTKGIITSIDFNGNTCQVRIPLFETAGNDPITGTAIVSNTPGSYNGYKVGDVVLVAFEDGKMQNPVIVGKLYLGAAKEKQDPRGTINVETTTASKSASLPADAVLTANVDSNVPNTNTPFGSLASIANNLNSLNTDVNQLDRFTRNQFNSVITDVNDQGEQLRSEIKQTASNIEANVVHTHKDGSQDALGWDLTTDSWKINAQDTVNDKVKDINIVTIDRSGMTLSGDLKLNGYPKNITVLYVRIDPNTELPQLYEFKSVDFPETSPETPIDNAWYYGKYIKITEAETGKEKYVLILKENFEYYNKLEQLKPGETIAYNREIASDWSTTVPERVDGQYIWQWTHTEIYSFDKANNVWNEKDDDKVVCITGAKGETGKEGAPGKDGTNGTNGYNTVTVMLYKRSKTSISGNPISGDLYYKFSDQKLYTNEGCTTEYTLPTDWSYTISGTGDSSNGDLYCIAAVAHSNTESDKIPHSEWAGPTLYVKNGEPTITLSIKNDFDSVPCDFNGTPSYSTQDWQDNTSHTIQVLEGQDQQQFSVIADSSDKQIPSTGYAVVYKPDSSITYVVDTTDKTLSNFTAHITGLTTDSANVLYTLYKNGIAIDEARFMATKLKAGAPGDPAVDYDILFSSSTIKVSKTGNKTPKTINVNFKKTVGQAEPVDFSGTYKVFVDNGTEPISQGTASSIILATSGAADQQIDVSSAKSSVIVELYTADGNTKLEGETIDVVADGTDGTSVAQLILYKRSTEIPSGPASDGKWTYNAAKGSLTCSNTETKWKTGIPSGTDPCYESHAVVVVTGLGTTTVTEWSEPAKFVENGTPGISIIENKQWYILWPADNKNEPGKPDAANKLDKPDATPTTLRMWIPIPPEAVNDHIVWTCYESIFSNGHSEYSEPVKDNAYALAQGKTTNYYSPTEPVNKIKMGDCWFDTGYVKIATNPENRAGYLGKFVLHSDQDQNIKVDDKDKIYVEGINPDTSGAFTRFIPSKSESSQLYMVKITPDNIDDENLFTVKTEDTAGTDAYETGNLKQCSGFDAANKAIWEDIAGELVTNKLTANYINAMDIISKKIKVLDSNNDTLFLADGINGNGEVKIGGFTVDSNRLYIGAPGKNDSIELSSIHNLIAYKSTNERTASSYAFVKIIVNNDTNLTIYIRSDATKYPDDNYMMVSTPNAAPYPDYYTDSRVKEHTCGQPNTGKNLNDYARVEYCGLKKGDYILVIYKRGEIATDATDAGYFLIPDTPDITVSGVSSQFSFTKDSSLDINGVAGASLKIGSNFSVDYTGAIKSTSGTIGNFKVSPYGLTFGKDDSTRQFSLKNFTTQLQAYTSKQSIPHNSDNTAVMKVTIKKDSAYFKLFVDSLCSYGLEASHYIIISNLNTESIPTDWTDGGVYYTNADNLYFTNYSDDDYTSHETVYGKVDNAVPVVFKNVKENDYFYIIFKLKQSNDPGYGHTINSQAIVFIPNNNTCIVSNVSDKYNWSRNSTKDTTIENTTLDIGNKFNVTDDGTLMARTGLFGPWMLTSEKLAYNYNDYLYSSKYKPYLTEAGNNKKKYASAYRYNNAAYWNGDGLILSTQKELDTSTTGWGDYRGPKTVNVGTEISAGGGVESTRIVRKLWNNDLNKFKSFPVICNVNNSVKINSTATNQEKSVITTVDAICTIKVDSTGNDWKKLPKSAYANMVPSFGFIVKTNLNEEYTGISTSNVRIKMSEVSSPIKKVITEVEYKLDYSRINGQTAAGHGTLVLFGKATSGFSEDKN